MTHLATLFFGAVIMVFMIARAHRPSVRGGETARPDLPWALF
jgi:hypothetical protein